MCSLECLKKRGTTIFGNPHLNPSIERKPCQQPFRIPTSRIWIIRIQICRFIVAWKVPHLRKEKGNHEQLVLTLLLCRGCWVQGCWFLNLILFEKCETKQKKRSGTKNSTLRMIGFQVQYHTWLHYPSQTNKNKTWVFGNKFLPFASQKKTGFGKLPALMVSLFHLGWMEQRGWMDEDEWMNLNSEYEFIQSYKSELRVWNWKWIELHTPH